MNKRAAMENRFNRPISAEQVESLIHQLRTGALAREAVDAHHADLLFRALHTVKLLWRECSLHNNLAATAADVLEATEKKLRECVEAQSVEAASAALAEVERLKGIIRTPPDTHATWADDDELRHGTNW